MMRLYISGPITGVYNYRAKFKEAEQRLKWAGYDNLINPAEICEVLPAEHTSYEEYMRMSLELLSMADAVVLLPGWEKSIGCNRELGYAIGTDKIVLEYEELLKGGGQNGAC